MYTTNRAKHTADYDIPERRAPSRASSQTKISLMEQRSNNRAVSLKKRTTEAERLKEEVRNIRASRRNANAPLCL
jgi:hypothetical protein